jgi:hypothetical protein
MIDNPKTSPAPEAGDDEAALWNEIEQAESQGAEPPPPAQGREPEATEADPAFETDDNEADTEARDAAPAASQDAAGEQQAPSDIWSSAPPELKAAFEEERRARTNLEHAIRSDRGRLSAMQKKLDELSRNSPNPAHQPVRGESADDRNERLRKLAEEYPEVAQPLLDEMDALRSTVTSLQSVEEERAKQAYAYQEQVLATEHADWQQVLSQNGATFAAWLDDQPKAVRDAAQANANRIVDAKAAADVVGRFKQFIGIAGQQQQPAAAGNPQPSLSDKRQRQLAASATPRGVRRPVASGIPEDGDEEAIWAAFEAQEARQGR